MPPTTRESALSTVATTLLLAESGDGGGFHAPSIADFFPGGIFFDGTVFEVNRIIMVRLIAAAVLLILFMTVASRAKLVPGRVQNAIEMVLDFARVQIAEEILGKEKAAPFVPMLTTIFVSIIFFNITGVIPGLNISSTALIGLPLLLAFWVYVVYLSAGVRAQGIGPFLKNNLFPPGAPAFMYVLLTPIEILQVFLLRPATLALRLTANMIAGHIMLALAFAATQFFLFDAAGVLKAFSALSLVGGIAFTLFEVLVAVLQAYIFALLAAVYLNLSLEAEH